MTLTPHPEAMKRLLHDMRHVNIESTVVPDGYALTSDGRDDFVDTLVSRSEQAHYVQRAQEQAAQ